MQFSGATSASCELRGRKERARPKTYYSSDQFLYLQVPKPPTLSTYTKYINSNANWMLKQVNLKKKIKVS